MERKESRLPAVRSIAWLDGKRRSMLNTESVDFLRLIEAKSPAALPDRQTQPIKCGANSHDKNNRNNHRDHARDVLPCYCDDQPCGGEGQDDGDDIDVCRWSLIGEHGV